jgi:hypothetical protein
MDQTFNLKTWYGWAEQDCLKAGRIRKFREYLNFDSERMVRRMDCIQPNRILEDIPGSLEKVDHE